MRLYTALAVTVATAVVTLNFWQVSSEPDRPVIVDDIQHLVVEANDDLTLMLRSQAHTACSRCNSGRRGSSSRLRGIRAIRQIAHACNLSFAAAH